MTLIRQIHRGQSVIRPGQNGVNTPCRQRPYSATLGKLNGETGGCVRHGTLLIPPSFALAHGAKRRVASRPLLGRGVTVSVADGTC